MDAHNVPVNKAQFEMYQGYTGGATIHHFDRTPNEPPKFSIFRGDTIKHEENVYQKIVSAEGNKRRELDKRDGFRGISEKDAKYVGFPWDTDDSRKTPWTLPKGKLCRNCLNPIKSVPKRIPYKRNKIGEFIFGVESFCQWACAIRHENSNRSYETPTRIVWMHQIARDIDGIYIVPNLPDPGVIDCFDGGFVDKHTYKNWGEQADFDSKIVQAPFIHASKMVEFRGFDPANYGYKRKPIDNTTISIKTSGKRTPVNKTEVKGEVKEEEGLETGLEEGSELKSVDIQDKTTKSNIINKSSDVGVWDVHNLKRPSKEEIQARLDARPRTEHRHYVNYAKYIKKRSEEEGVPLDLSLLKLDEDAEYKRGLLYRDVTVDVEDEEDFVEDRPKLVEGTEEVGGDEEEKGYDDVFEVGEHNICIDGSSFSKKDRLVSAQNKKMGIKRTMGGIGGARRSRRRGQREKVRASNV